METHWAIDLGTTNTLIAKWVGTHAVTVALEDLVDYEPAWQTPLIPSAIYFQDAGRAIIGLHPQAHDDQRQDQQGGAAPDPAGTSRHKPAHPVPQADRSLYLVAQPGFSPEGAD